MISTQLATQKTHFEIFAGKLRQSNCKTFDRHLLNFGNLSRIIFPKIKDMVVSINNSTYLFLLGELNVNHKGWLTDFGKSNRW